MTIKTPGSDRPGCPEAVPGEETASGRAGGGSEASSPPVGPATVPGGAVAGPQTPSQPHGGWAGTDQTRALPRGAQAGESAAPARARRGSGEAARRARRLHPLVGRLTRIRYEAGLSGRQVAEVAGLHLSLIHKWESGVGLPSLDSLATWANALGYDLVLRKRERPDG
jgi:DNA-binding transcriptional regulator YiaG